nr:MAG TPA: hypothetical protein [Caudoviricetes sp.]
MASTGIKVVRSGTDANSTTRFHSLNFVSSSSPDCNRRPCRLSLTLI